MGFGSLSSDSGLNALNQFLQDKSYIEGYVPSQADVAVYEAVSSCPSDKYPHVLRWYKQVKSYQAQFSSLPGIKKPLDQYGPAGAAAAPSKDDDDDDDDDDDVDLFGSDDEEDEEAERIRKERLEMYKEKKSKKAAVIAKSNIIYDVKPWDDETDMKELEKHVRSINMEGLLWGASKLVEVGYGIKKLQISVVVEDEKVPLDDLETEITSREDLIQSVDIAAFNKV